MWRRCSKSTRAACWRTSVTTSPMPRAKDSTAEFKQSNRPPAVSARLRTTESASCSTAGSSTYCPKSATKTPEEPPPGGSSDSEGRAAASPDISYAYLLGVVARKSFARVRLLRLGAKRPLSPMGVASFGLAKLSLVGEEVIEQFDGREFLPDSCWRDGTRFAAPSPRRVLQLSRSLGGSCSLAL